jgi:hypothetical protein
MQYYEISQAMSDPNSDLKPLPDFARVSEQVSKNPRVFSEAFRREVPADRIWEITGWDPAEAS